MGHATSIDSTVVEIDREPDFSADYLQSPKRHIKGDIALWQDGFHWATLVPHTRGLTHGREIAAVGDGDIIARGAIKSFANAPVGIHLSVQPNTHAVYHGDDV